MAVHGVELSPADVTAGIVGDPNTPGRPNYSNIFTGYGNVVRFFRPMRSASDFNGDDRITTIQTGQNLSLNVVTTGKTIRDLSPTVSPEQPAEDDSVDFNVSVDNPGGTRFTYSWTFGDGSPAVGEQNPSHPFKAGSYQPTVYAFGDDGSAGVAVLPDLVVKQKSAATPTPTPTATPSATATGMPSGGEGPSASGTGGEAPTGGGAGDKRDRTSGPRKSQGRDDDSRKGKAMATATAAATATSAPATGGDDGGGGTPGAEATGTPAAASDAQATPRAAPARPSTAQGERVEGILLADSGTVADILAAARSAEAPEQVRSQARAGGGGSESVAEWVGGGALLFALLAAGAAREGVFRR